MEKFELTFPQKNIWLVENFYESKLINIISGSLIIKKDFEISKAEQTVNKFVEINEGMRLRICVENSIPKQYVSSFAPFEADKINVEGKTEQEIDKIKEEYISTGFDVIEKPLFSYLLIDRGNGVGEIFLKAHHLICDAWSISKMCTSLCNIYEAILSGNEILDVNPSYTDFILTEQEYINSEKYSKDSEFWIEYLKGMTDIVGLKDTIVAGNTLAKRYTIKLDNEFQNLIYEYCKQNRLSPYVLFLTALAIYIERVKEKTDFAIGTPVLNRSNFKEKNMIGMFVSTMPVRFNIDEQDAFLDVCKKVASDSMTLFRHQKYPYSKISEAYKELNGVSDNMYKVMLSYQNARSEIVDTTKYEIKWRFSGNIQNELEIHIEDLNASGNLDVHFDYITSLFDDIEIEYLAQRIFTIIKDGIINNKTIENIDIMPNEERDKILGEFNDTKREYPKDKTVIDLFEEQVKLNPNKTALFFEGEELTYDELNIKANRFAHYLKDKGIKEHDFIAIIMDKSLELMISILATLKVGACYVPIDTEYSLERKKYIIDDAKCKVNITSDEAEDYIDNINIKKLQLDNYSAENIVRSSDYIWDSLVYVMYTSGTTGKPKGAMVTNRNIVRLVKNTNYITFEQEDRIIQTGATVFDASTFEYWGALLNGLSLCLIKKIDLLDPFLLEKFVDKNKITIMWLTAPLFSQMIEANINIFKNIRVVLAGGDVLSVKHVNKLRSMYSNITVVNGYGPTENTTFSNCHIVDKDYAKRIPIGEPIANSTCYVVDSKFRLMPIYVHGELVVGGDGVSKGYINNYKLTREKFVPDIFQKNGMLYKTGDIVCWKKEGVIDFIGRRDNQVKIRGFRIELDEIKNCIQKYGKIKEAVTIVKTHDSNQKELYAYFVSEQQEDMHKLTDFLKENLAKYMVPKAIMQIDQIPLNVNGKVDLNKLPEIKINNQVKQQVDLTEEQKNIIRIINEELKVEIQNPKVSLFDYGLDSLNIIQISVVLSKEYESSLSASELIKEPTVDAIIELLKNKKKDTYISDSQNANRIELTSVQKGIFTNYMNNTDSLRYNIPFEVIFQKSIDCFKLKECIEQIINNYDIFHMNIEIQSGEIFGKINKKEIIIPISKIGYTEFLNEKLEFVKPMDLLNDKLFNIKIYDLEKDIRVLFDFNHIIFDGYSMSLFLDNIIKLYMGQATNLSNSITMKTILEDEYNSSKRFMMEKFSQLPSVTSVAFNTEINDEKGSIKNIILNKETNECIRTMAKNNHITVNSLFNSLFVLALANITKNKDIVIGVSTLGRKEGELNTIGMYVNTIPIRYNISELSLKDFTLDCQNNIFEYMKNDGYPYFDLIKDLKIPRKLGKNPLFDIAYSYQIKDKVLNSIDNSTIEINPIYTNTAKFELSCQIIDDGEMPNIILEYNSLMVSEETVDEILKYMMKIINNIENYINTSILDLVKVEEQNTTDIILQIESRSNSKQQELTQNEMFVLDIYKGVLQQDIGMDDDFFEVGGDSLLAIKLVSEFMANDISVTYSDVFEYKTPRKMTAKIYENEENSRIDADIEEYDYSRIEQVLNNQREPLKNNNPIGNILLTGATGFLGAHILDNYLRTQEGIVYCLVRKIGTTSGEIRLRERLHFFFNNKYDEEFGRRIKVIEGDIIYPNLLEQGNIPKDIIDNIDIVINSAAHVKHYGNKDLFNKINVLGVKNLIEFCRINKIRLVQISTLSVSGNLIESGQIEQTIEYGTHFNEQNLYIGQNLNNIYAYTKFLAEREILEQVAKGNINATIIRMGNLTGRTTDGKFQPNVEDNAFANRIKSILEIEKIPKNIEKLYLEFTPIDISAECIIDICKCTEEQVIYHIFNHKHLPMTKAYELLRNMGYNLSWVSKEEMHNLIQDLIKDEQKRSKISGIIQDLNSNSDLEYTSNTIIDSEITCNILKKHNFDWKEITDEYFYHYIQYLRDIKFLKGGNNDN